MHLNKNLKQRVRNALIEAVDAMECACGIRGPWITTVGQGTIPASDPKQPGVFYTIEGEKIKPAEAALKKDREHEPMWWEYHKVHDYHELCLLLEEIK